MKLILATLLCISGLFAQMKVGETAKDTVISTKNGGYVNGTDFDTKVLKGKVSILLYADPDEQSAGEKLSGALDLLMKKLPATLATRYMVINLDDTWKPNFVINKILKGKQKDNPESMYVTDEDFILGKAWDLPHDSFICIVLDAEKKALYVKKAPFSRDEIQKIVSLIWAEVEQTKNKGK